MSKRKLDISEGVITRSKKRKLDEIDRMMNVRVLCTPLSKAELNKFVHSQTNSPVEKGNTMKINQKVSIFRKKFDRLYEKLI